MKKKHVNKPGEFVRASGEKLIESTASWEKPGKAQFIAAGEPCMLISVLKAQKDGRWVECHGFMRAGATTLGWITLSVKNAHSFWIR